jgi:hypothetical protein
MTHKNCVPAWDSYWHKWQVSTAISNLKNCLFTTSSVRCLTALLTATEGSNESEDQVSFSHFYSLTPFPVNDSQIQPMPTCYGISVANNFANLKSVIL